jgi:hypothetical protein
MVKIRENPNSGLPINLPDKVKTVGAPDEDPPARGCPLNKAGVVRIVEAVGNKFVPKGLSQNALRRDLLWCYTCWRTYVELGSDKNARQRIEYLQRIKKAATALRAFFDDPIGGWAMDRIGDSFPLKEGGPVRITAGWRKDHGQPDPACSFSGFRAGLDRMVEAANYRAQSEPTVAVLNLPRSPVEYLIGNNLAECFEKHFGRKPGRSRDGYDNQIKGPYIRFVEGALKELGITNRGKAYKPETISKVLSDVTAGRSRRRGREKH